MRQVDEGPLIGRRLAVSIEYYAGPTEGTAFETLMRENSQLLGDDDLGTVVPSDDLLQLAI
jgi:hypothetical protein